MEYKITRNKYNKTNILYNFRSLKSFIILTDRKLSLVAYIMKIKEGTIRGLF